MATAERFQASNVLLIEKYQAFLSQPDDQRSLVALVNRTNAKLKKTVARRVQASQSGFIVHILQPHLINFFEEIGWHDPYRQAADVMPNENQNVMFADFEKLVYDQSKFNPDYPPSIKYIPNSTLLIRMFKACRGAKTIREILEKFVECAPHSHNFNFSI